jgi:hypothetical protein
MTEKRKEEGASLRGDPSASVGMTEWGAREGDKQSIALLTRGCVAGGGGYRLYFGRCCSGIFDGFAGDICQG